MITYTHHGSPSTEEPSLNTVTKLDGSALASFKISSCVNFCRFVFAGADVPSLEIAKPVEPPAAPDGTEEYAFSPSKGAVARGMGRDELTCE
jgi:hypothetical protein